MSAWRTRTRFITTWWLILPCESSCQLIPTLPYHPTTVPDRAQLLDLEARHGWGGLSDKGKGERPPSRTSLPAPSKAEVPSVALCVLEKALGFEPNIGCRVEGLEACVRNTIAHVDSRYALTLSVVPASVQSADHCRDHRADFEIYHETFPTPFPDTVEGAACQVPPSARMRRRTSHSFMYLEGSKPLSFLFWSRPW